MKHRKRTPSGKPPGAKVPPTSSGSGESGGSAFDVWLERGLHQLFDEVASEPIPPELLQLIEGDRPKPGDDEPKSEDPRSEAD